MKKIEISLTSKGKIFDIDTFNFLTPQEIIDPDSIKVEMDGEINFKEAQALIHIINSWHRE